MSTVMELASFDHCQLSVLRSMTCMINAPNVAGLRNVYTSNLVCILDQRQVVPAAMDAGGARRLPGLSGMMKKSLGCPCSSMVVVNSGFGHWQVPPSRKMSPCRASGATLACTARPALLRCVLLLALLSCLRSLCWHLFGDRVHL